MKQKAPLQVAMDIAFENFYNPFHKTFNTVKCAIAGSILRKKETVHDIDIVIGTSDPSIKEWVRLEIDSHDNPDAFNYKGSLYGLHTDVWFTVPESWAPMLLFATGPKDFNIFMRRRAKDQDMVLNHLGLFERKQFEDDFALGPRIDNNTEGNIIWHVLRRRWIPPEKRDFYHFLPHERVQEDCPLCKTHFSKGDRLVRSDAGDWIHEVHIT